MAVLESSKATLSAFLSASGLAFASQGIRKQGKKYAAH